MLSREELIEIAELEIFSGLTDQSFAWLGHNGSIESFAKGTHLITHGNPVEHLIVVLEGELQVLLFEKGQLRPLGIQARGDVSGILPYSRMKNSPANLLAKSDLKVFRLHKDLFSEMERVSPLLSQRLVAKMTDRVRIGASQQQQQEKLAALGQLAAGLAHELNNPAAAVARSASELEKHLNALCSQSLGNQNQEGLSILFCAEKPKTIQISALERSEREDSLTDWLEDRGVESAFEIAPDLVNQGVRVEDLEANFAQVEPDQLHQLLSLSTHLSASLTLNRNIQEASKRISDLVQSIKSYSHMDRSQEKQPASLQEGIESTITMLEHKAKRKSIRFVRNFPSLPQVPIFVSELNQVWTNLIDNAIDASPEGGAIQLGASVEGDFVVATVEDQGEGIPAEIQQKIYDPFFTTKPMGHGSGMGLDISNRIVANHDGELAFDSRPGRTVFSVSLPLKEQ